VETEFNDVSAQKADPTVQKKEPQVTLGAVSKKIVDLYDIPRIREMEVREPNWLIEDFILKHGVHIFSGPPGSMKSFLSLYKARALSAGLEIYGVNATQTPVAYLDRENPLELIQKRYNLLHIEDDENLRYWGMWADEQPPKLDPCPYPDPRQRLLDWAAKHQPVIFIDPLIAFHSKEENSASEMRHITDFLKQLRFAGATVIVLHHQGKPGIEGYASQFRGSSEILAACDMAFLVQKIEDGEDAILSVKSFKNRLGLPIAHRLKFDSKRGLFLPLDPLVKVDQTEVEVAAIAQFITANPGLGVEVIRSATKIPEQRLRDLLNKNPKGLWRTEVGAHNKQRYFPAEFIS